DLAIIIKEAYNHVKTKDDDVEPGAVRLAPGIFNLRSNVNELEKLLYEDVGNAAGGGSLLLNDDGTCRNWDMFMGKVFNTYTTSTDKNVKLRTSMTTPFLLGSAKAASQQTTYESEFGDNFQIEDKSLA